MTDENHELPDILGEDLGYLLGWVALGETLGDDDGEEAARAMGAAIVGGEEMQAIKAVRRHLAVRQATEVQAPTVDVMRLLGLPDVVVEWVLSRASTSTNAGVMCDEVDALRETVKSLVVAAGRMRDGWAEGDDAVEQQRWQALHTAADDADDRHGIYPL